MVRVSVFARESKREYHWVQHFALLPRVPEVGERIRWEGSDGSEARWYGVERVLHIPLEPEDGDEEAWSAMVFAVAERSATSAPALSAKPLPAERNERSAPPWNGYVFAATGIVAALLINLIAGRFGDTKAFFILFVISVAAVAALRGWGPGIFASLGAAVAVLFFFIDPVYTFGIAHSEDGYRFVGFMLAIFAACLMAMICRSQHFASRRAR
jgi:hypothetical protein